MTDLQGWGIIVSIAVTGLGGLITLIRFMVKHYLYELKPNGGNSMKDQVNRLEARVDTIIRLLEK